MVWPFLSAVPCHSGFRFWFIGVWRSDASTQNVCDMLMMLTLARINYRFMQPKQQVFDITRAGGSSGNTFATKQVFSAPVQMRQTDEVLNAVLGFACKEACEDFASSLSDSVAVASMPLADLQHTSHTLRMPFVVLMSSYCNLSDHSLCHDVYFKHARCM